MNSVSNKVAAGAVWMVGLKLIERSIGFVSTLILARLLMPADFGLVAMAMAIFALLAVLGQFGFDFALIRDKNASRKHYDTAWTLSVCYGFFSGLALAALAGPAAVFFSEPRLESVVYVLAIVAFVEGLGNIGVVNFRKEFRFGKDFQLLLIRKVIAFAVTLGAAMMFRSYWALIVGMTTSCVAGVVLSYLLHPYRPRIDFSQTRELFNFSKWIVLTRIIQYFGERGPDFLIGRFLDATALGFYRVGHEISTLPTTELIYPIMRAVFPGYAAVAHDRPALARSFLGVQGAIVMLALPAGVGIVMLADPMVRVLLGPNWLEIIPLVQILGIYGAFTVFQATNHSVFNVLGVPYWSTALRAVEVVILLPVLFVLLKNGHGLNSVAWGILAVHAVMIPFGILLVSRLLGVGFIDRLRVVWRPVLATTTMAIMLLALGLERAENAGTAALILLLAVPAGVAVYASTVASLWFIWGKPEGSERSLLNILLRRKAV